MVVVLAGLLIPALVLGSAHVTGMRLDAPVVRVHGGKSRRPSPPPPPPPPPARSDADIQAEAAKARAMARRRRGRGTTILAGQEETVGRPASREGAQTLGG